MVTDWKKPALRAVLLLIVGLTFWLLDDGMGWLWSAGFVLLLLAGDDAKDATLARRARKVAGRGS